MPSPRTFACAGRCSDDGVTRRRYELRHCTVKLRVCKGWDQQRSYQYSHDKHFRPRNRRLRAVLGAARDFDDNGFDGWGCGVGSSRALHMVSGSDLFKAHRRRLLSPWTISQYLQEVVDIRRASLLTLPGAGAVPWDAISATQAGSTLLKFGRHGNPHYRSVCRSLATY